MPASKALIVEGGGRLDEDERPMVMLALAVALAEFCSSDWPIPAAAKGLGAGAAGPAQAGWPFKIVRAPGSATC